MHSREIFAATLRTGEIYQGGRQRERSQQKLSMVDQLRPRVACDVGVRFPRAPRVQSPVPPSTLCSISKAARAGGAGAEVVWATRGIALLLGSRCRLLLPVQEGSSCEGSGRWR